MSQPIRPGGIHALGTVVPKAATPALRRRGFAQAAIVGRWSEVVGAELAAQSAPERLVFPRDGQAGGATLHVRASGVLALELQHLAPIVLERINGFFGYPAVARLALHQAPLPAKPNRPKKAAPRSLSAAETDAIDAAVARLDDERLREKLKALGRRVAAAQKPKPGNGM
ncbi:MAG: DUF721 domain-containing protein [Alphaproteobacteria bacterium]|nr:DUF721 domain-containing protein [Alphaproteobacteria bacterium]